MENPELKPPLVNRPITPEEYIRLSLVKIDRFLPEEFGQFGIDGKLIIIDADTRKAVSDERLVDKLQDNMNARFRGLLKKPYADFKVIFKTTFETKSNLEITRGVFRTPYQEYVFDKMVDGVLEEEAEKLGLMPLYSGIEPISGRKSYGFHFHWSAGSVLDTALLFNALRGELWRIVAFSANSFSEKDMFGPEMMCSRLGNTLVYKLGIEEIKLTEDELRVCEVENEVPGSEFPLLIHRETGTLEVRAADVDPNYFATVAYTNLLLRALQSRIAATKEVPCVSPELMQDQILQAKEYSITDAQEIDAIIGREIVKVPIRQEMIRHWEQELEPVLAALHPYRKPGPKRKFDQSFKGPFVPKSVIREIQTRIYDGLTPAARYVEAYKEALKDNPWDKAKFIVQGVNLH